VAVTRGVPPGDLALSWPPTTEDLDPRAVVGRYEGGAFDERRSVLEVGAAEPEAFHVEPETAIEVGAGDADVMHPGHARCIQNSLELDKVAGCPWP